MDILDIGAAVELVKSIPVSAAQRAEAAAAEAKAAADTVTSATVAEIESYLGIE